VKFFTPAEANEALGVVRPLVERLVERRRSFLEHDAELDRYRAKIATNGGGLDHRRFHELQEAAGEEAEEIARSLEAITALGVQVKDPDRGLVDFPARNPDGDPVLLCWHVGEGEVAYWHGLEDGFAGRKPLPF
jgi:hypothetical protein